MAVPTRFLFSVCLAFIYIKSGACSREKREDKTITVTTIEEKPYLMKDGDKYKGYIKDILDKISEKSKIKFNIILVKDGKYGKETGGTWNGMVGEVMRNTAQLAAAPMTMSEERKRVVDFTEPYMDVGTTILYRKPAGGGSPPFDSFKTLSEKKDIKYGAVKDGVTQSFFESSNDAVYKKMWQKMSSDSKSMVSTNLEGVQKVRNSTFAFIMESATANYWKSQEPCDLMTVGETINVNNHYAFALRKIDPDEIKDKLDNAIRELKEDGDLKKLEDKWWKDNAKCSACGFMPQISWILMSSLIAFFLR